MDSGGKRKPLKVVENFTTEVEFMKFNHDAQLLVVCLSKSKNGLKLVHVPSLTVFSNWPLPRFSLQNRGAWISVLEVDLWQLGIQMGRFCSTNCITITRLKCHFILVPGLNLLYLLYELFVSNFSFWMPMCSFILRTRYLSYVLHFICCWH